MDSRCNSQAGRFLLGMVVVILLVPTYAWAHGGHPPVQAENTPLHVAIHAVPGLSLFLAVMGLLTLAWALLPWNRKSLRLSRLSSVSERRAHQRESR